MIMMSPKRGDGFSIKHIFGLILGAVLGWILGIVFVVATDQPNEMHNLVFMIGIVSFAYIGYQLARRLIQIDDDNWI